MLERPNWAPRYIDLDKPSAARIYDYLLGGGCNAASDRAVAKRMLQVMPGVRTMARLNRAFLRRVVPFLVRAGIRQFLDIGSGIPGVGNVHELAQGLDPDCRVVYVDNDPIAIAHGELLLQHNELAATVTADFRRPEEVLGSPAVAGLLDLDRPTAVLTLLMLHFVTDQEELLGLMATYRSALATGSYLALSHPGGEHVPEMDALQQIMDAEVQPMRFRGPAELAPLVGEFDPVPPGLVHVPRWRPESPLDVGEHPERSLLYGVVAVKR